MDPGSESRMTLGGSGNHNMVDDGSNPKLRENVLKNVATLENFSTVFC